MPNQATVSVPTGAGVTTNLLTLSNVDSVNTDFVKSVLTVNYKVGDKPRISEFDIAGATTITHTISNGVHTVTVS